MVGVSIAQIPLDVRVDTVKYFLKAAISRATPGEVTLTTFEAMAVQSVIEDLEEVLFRAI